MKIKLLWAALAVVIVIVIAALVAASRLEPIAREYAIKALRERYKSDVELGDLKISLLPYLRATGENLVLRINGRKDVPPVVRIRHFTVSTSLLNAFRSPMHIGTLTLDGLEVTVPPRQAGGAHEAKPKAAFIIDEVTADGAKLTTLPKDAGKQPLFFEIHKLRLESAGAGERMNYDAELLNPKPRGMIHTQGAFGPWNADEPGDTELDGKYTFRDADLSVFKGIRGILSSDGSYKGHLDTLETTGSCDVPDFALSVGGHAMPLHTDFQATVDGVDGDTILHPVKARLGKSTFDVSGAIDRGALESKKTILLETKSVSAHLEDFLRLAMKSPKAPLTGPVRFQSTIKIPPGDTDVIQRLELEGVFALGRVTFTSPDVEEKISNLSHRAQGDPKEEGDVTAAFNGHFRLRDGTMNLPDIRFSVPGALISLAGTYELKGAALNFSGTARMDATVSEMTTGVKKLLLKPVDPLFKHDGAGTVLPIKIGGNAGQPSFSLDIGKALRR